MKNDSIVAETKAQIRNRFRSGKAKNRSDLFDKTHDFRIPQILHRIDSYPFFLQVEENSGPEVMIEGARCLMLGSNNYLGLSHHPEVILASIEVTRKYGTSLSGSRLLNGTGSLHLELEKKVADFLNKESALVFSSGYQVNLGVISALAGVGDYVIMDRLCHASLIDGAKLSKAESLFFKHNDAVDLENILQRLPENTGKLVVVEGIYSMDGDLADMETIVAVAKKYGARIMVDDAHAFGVLGQQGRGAASHFCLEQNIDLIVVSMGKTLASVGGFVAGDAAVIDYIKHFGRSMLFSASLPPSATMAALKALEIMQAEPERIARLRHNSEYMRLQLTAMDFNIGNSASPVVPIIIGDDFTTLQCWKELLNQGIYVNSVYYPAVARNGAMLRTSYSSEHTREQLDYALSVFRGLKEKYSI